MKIEEYAEIFRRAIKEVGSENAAIAILQEVGKDLRQSQIPKKDKESGNQPASQKQLDLIRKFMKDGKLEVKDVSNLTKSEANGIIKEVLKK
jgi:hypothetical protein